MISSRTDSVLFVCLANSYKLGGRCIAGIQIASENKTSPIFDEKGNPKWIRPVDRVTEGKAIPNEVAKNICVGDLIKLVNPIPCPTYAQQENVYYDDMIVVGRLNGLEGIDLFITKIRGGLFGNYGKAVIPERYQELSYSILLVHPHDISFYLLDRTEMNKKPQPRVKFHLSSREYDFPVTDPAYYDLIIGDIDAANSPGNYYITVSLGLEHGGYHSKLAACIIKCTNEVHVTDRSGAVEKPSIIESIPLPTIEDLPPEKYLSEFDENTLLEKSNTNQDNGPQHPHTWINGRMYYVDEGVLDSSQETNRDSKEIRAERESHFESLKSFKYVVSTMPDVSDVEFFKPSLVEEKPVRSNALTKRYYKYDDKFVPSKKLGETSQVFLVKACRPIHFSICQEDVVSYFLNNSYRVLCRPWLDDVWKRRDSEYSLAHYAAYFAGNSSSISNWHMYDYIELDDNYNFKRERGLKDAIFESASKLEEYKANEISEQRLADIVAFEKMRINFDERNDKQNINNAFLSFFSFLLNNNPNAVVIFAKVFVLAEQYKISEKLWNEEISRLCDFLDPKSEIKSRAIESHYEYVDESGNTVISLPLDTIGMSPIIPKGLIVWITPHPKSPGKSYLTLADITGYIYYKWEIYRDEVRYCFDDGRILSRIGFDKNGIRIGGASGCKSYMTVLGIREERLDIETVQIKITTPESLQVISLDGTNIPPTKDGILKDGRTLCRYYVINENNKRYLIAIDGRHEIDEATYSRIKSY